MNASQTNASHRKQLSLATVANRPEIDTDKWTATPERILQFGTGVLLRGLIGWTVYQANKKGLFSGRIVAVASTGSGRTRMINEQDGLFTQRIEGYYKGQEVGEFQLNPCMSRALAAADEWAKVMACARNPEIDIIISNTTEAGLQYVKEDLFASPPSSFPAKLTAFLYERFQHHPEACCVLLPTELLVDNGKILKGLVLRQVEDHALGADFRNWLEKENYFCNTLVDRIVTGMPNLEKYATFAEELGYEDSLLTVSEVYALWAIEGPAHLIDRISFVKADDGIMLINDIEPFRERKLRILNGSHSISVALGYLSGLDNVYDCMTTSDMSAFIDRVVKQEIVPSLPDTVGEGLPFAEEVLDRFRNPFLDHKLLSITFQYTSKMRYRNALTIRRYIDKFGHPPRLMSLGIAAVILFLHPKKEEKGTYYGEWQGKSYAINDDLAGWWHTQWENGPDNTSEIDFVQSWVRKLFEDKTVWDDAFQDMPGLMENISELLLQLIQQGITPTLQKVLSEAQ